VVPESAPVCFIFKKRFFRKNGRKNEEVSSEGDVFYDILSSSKLLWFFWCILQNNKLLLVFKNSF